TGWGTFYPGKGFPKLFGVFFPFLLAEPVPECFVPRYPTHAGWRFAYQAYELPHIENPAGRIRRSRHPA
ncbi:hypothetical protein, partial [Salmonella enterica]|uniref:hypothetical protein n=1 Tax=Salmonella enterica TaxID=28901 RepID=UPI001C62780B